MMHSIEMLEILVAGKIMSKDLKISDVYEKVWYPHLYRHANPDAFEVPPFNPKDITYLKKPMEVKYRLAGLDGEATEDRVENLD